MSETPLKVLKLIASNVKRIEVAEIHPDGSLVVISGANGAGKTSLIDSLEWGLRGKTAMQDVPVRTGADRATIDIDLGPEYGQPPEFIVERVVTPKGGSLVVRSAAGARFDSPQALLDKLMGKVAIDPLAFARLKPAEQRAQLQRLVGLDLSVLDGERATVYEERTAVNKLVATMDALLAGTKEQDAPSEPVSVVSLVAELERRDAVNKSNEAQRKAVEIAAKRVTVAREETANAAREIVDQQHRLDVLRQKHEAAVATEAARAAAHLQLVTAESALVDADAAEVRAQIAASEETNRKVRENAERAAVVTNLAATKDQAAKLTERIEAIDAEKAAKLAAAPFPVPGLGFSDVGVTMRGVPFEQASAAERLRTSVAMAIAANPRLRVLVVRDGSLLDEKSLAMVAEMAEAAGAQVWLETVGERGDATVIIEEGRVRGATVAAEVQP